MNEREPDDLTPIERGKHGTGHSVRRIGVNRFECETCKEEWRMRKNTALARRRLLR